DRAAELIDTRIGGIESPSVTGRKQIAALAIREGNEELRPRGAERSKEAVNTDNRRINAAPESFDYLEIAGRQRTRNEGHGIGRQSTGEPHVVTSIAVSSERRCKEKREDQEAAA